MVSEFEGSDRAEGFRSSPADVRERFFVVPPSDAVAPPSVVTQARASVPVGEPFSDSALVQGADAVLSGTHLVFEAYGPQDPDSPPVCVTPFFTSEQIPVDHGAGIYESGATTAAAAGVVYWVESLYSAKGDLLHRGECGLPSETTVVTELHIDSHAEPSSSPTPEPRDNPRPTGTPTPGPDIREVPPESPATAPEQPQLAETGWPSAPLLLIATALVLGAVCAYGTSVAVRRRRANR